MPQTGPLPGRATLASPDLAKVEVTHMTEKIQEAAGAGAPRGRVLWDFGQAETRDH